MIDSRMSIYNNAGAPMTRVADEIRFCDVTLRDGEQTAGVAFSLDEKIEIARLLDSAGLQQIQLSSPLQSESARVDAETICALGLNADIEVMSHSAGRRWKESIKAAIDSGADVIHSLLPFSPKMRGMFTPLLSDDEIVERAYDAVVYAREQGARVLNISLLDATRTDEELTKKTLAALLEAGVDRIRFADTVGTAWPRGIYALASLYRDFVDTHCRGKKPLLAFHCHNDFGLATANVFAAIEAGVDLIDVTVNGLGERSGNPDLAQIAVGLEVFFGKKAPVDVLRLKGISDEIARISGIPVPPNRPLTGALAFSDESEAHVSATSVDPYSYQGILPESIGNIHHIIMGKKSGPKSIEEKLKTLGLPPLDPEKTQRLLDRVRAESANRRGSIVSDEEFAAFVKQLEA